MNNNNHKKKTSLFRKCEQTENKSANNSIFPTKESVIQNHCHFILYYYILRYYIFDCGKSISMSREIL